MLGVGDGERVLHFLDTWPLGVFYLVDPFIHLFRGYDSPENLSDKEQQLRFESLRN